MTRFATSAYKRKKIIEYNNLPPCTYKKYFLKWEATLLKVTSFFEKIAILFPFARVPTPLYGIYNAYTYPHSCLFL
jgi:hypothetical protein